MMKKSNLGQENSNVESTNEKKEEEKVDFVEDSVTHVAGSNEGRANSDPANKKRHGCVTTWLVMVLVITAVSIFANLAEGFYYPWNIYFLMSVGQLVCVILMFNWKIIGFWGFVGIQLPAFFLNMSVGLETFDSLVGLLAPVILYAIMQIKRNNISAWDQLD